MSVQGQAASAIAGIGFTRRSNLRFVPVAYRQEHFLGEVKIAALFPVVLEDMGLND
jgi:hypothetical protein